MELLIIDEISMVRPDILDTIDRKLRWVYESDEPFGGVQVIMFGDLFQLPPVTKKQEREILSDFMMAFSFQRLSFQTHRFPHCRANKNIQANRT